MCSRVLGPQDSDFLLSQECVLTLGLERCTQCLQDNWVCAFPPGSVTLTTSATVPFATSGSIVTGAQDWDMDIPGWRAGALLRPSPWGMTPCADRAFGHQRTDGTRRFLFMLFHACVLTFRVDLQGNLMRPCCR